MQNKIVSKNDLLQALYGVKKSDIDQIRSRMTVLPDGRHKLKFATLTPAGCYLRTVLCKAFNHLLALFKPWFEYNYVH